MAYKCYKYMESLAQNILGMNLDITCWLMKFGSHSIFSIGNRKENILISFYLTIFFNTIDNVFSLMKPSIKWNNLCFFRISRRMG